MKVFVAGASGALGTQLVPELAAAGHRVVAMTRTASKQDGLPCSPRLPLDPPHSNFLGRVTVSSDAGY
jgi:nucleoside-diphosphate-sugar epimerase